MKKKFVIIGFPKCGQVSIIDYMRTKNKDIIVKKDELIWNKKGPEIFLEKYSDRVIPFIITRDPIERMWSAYNYFQFGGDDWEHGHGDPPICHQMSFPKYLDLKGYEHHLGEMNPVSQSNYAKWYVHWKDLGLIKTFRLEDLKKTENFPHKNITQNVTKHWKGTTIPSMPKEYRKLAQTKLELEIQEHKEPSWSVDYL